MALLRLAEHAVFDATDGAGVILDTRRGVYLSLNPTATLMLETALRCESVDETVEHLLRRVDASAADLRSGVESLLAQLRQARLLPSMEAERG